MLRDVTERKEAEQKIMVRDRAIASFINAVAFTDLQGNLTFVNQAFLNMWGYDDEKEVLGKPATEFWHLREKASEVMETVRDKGSWTGELTAKKADGSTFNVHLSASIVKDNVGKPVSMMASFIDTTEQNQLRNKLTMANEKLNVIGNLTRHAIRDKIAALSENVFLAEQKAAHNDQVLEHLDRIKQALKLIEKILNFAEAYERTSVEKLVYLDVRETFTEAVSLFPDLKGVKIVNECGGLTVLADSLLRQIFYNLIDNSLRYAEKASQIRVRYKTGKDELELVYEDDGVGVPEAEKEKTFKKAHRKNTDYGLYLIKKAFEVYGWTIRETGIPGKGAQFIITIPKTRGGREENYRISRRL
jgi:PAS domain S-box-containing protein